MDIQKRMQYITSSRFTFKDSLSINTYEYNIHLQNLPVTKSEKAKIIAQIASQDKKNASQEAFQLINFVELFQKKISNACKSAKIYPAFKQKQQIKKFIIFGFMKEVLLFISYIYKNTKQYQRETELYNLKNKMYFKWDINKQSSKTGSTVLDKTDLEFFSVSFILYLRQNDKFSHQFWKKQIKKGQNEDQKLLIQKLICHLLGNSSDYIVIKGQHSTFYILYNNEVLGKGGFGFVNKGQQISIGEEDEIIIEDCAIKICKRTVSEYKNQGFSISQERQHKMLLQIHKFCKLKMKQDSKYIISLRDIVVHSDKKYLIYEYCMYNSLKQYLKKQIFNPKQLFQIAFQLIKALKLIHHQIIENQEEFYKFSIQIPNDRQINEDIIRFDKIVDKQRKNKGIIHRDLKLNNILIKQISQSHVLIKVIDWAFSKRTYIDEPISKIQCGTAQYHAPQLEDKKQYSSKVDIWAFGVIMFEILNMKPFYDRSKLGIKKRAEEQIDKIKFDEKSFKKEQISFWKNVLKCAMKYQPKERYDAQKLFNLFNNFELYKQWSQQQEFCFQKIVNIDQQFCLSKYLIQKEFCKTLIQSKLMRQSRQTIEKISPILIKHKIQGKIGLQYKHIAYAKQAIQKQYKGLSMLREINNLQKALNFISYTCPNIIDPSLIKFLIDECNNYCN